MGEPVDGAEAVEAGIVRENLDGIVQVLKIVVGDGIKGFW